MRGGYDAGGGKRSWRLFFIIIEKPGHRYHIQYALVLEDTPEYFWFENNLTEKTGDGGFVQLVLKRDEASGVTLTSDSFVSLKCKDGEHHFFAIDMGEGPGTAQVDTSVCFIPPNGRRVRVRPPIFLEAAPVKVSDSGLSAAAVGKLEEVCSTQLNLANTLTSHYRLVRDRVRPNQLYPNQLPSP